MAKRSGFMDRLNRRRFLRLSGLAGAAGLAGCSQSELQNDDDESGPISVGVVLPFSGDLSDFGEPMMNGIQLALSDINDAGGPMGRQIELHQEDSETNPTTGVTAANSLTNNQGIKCLIGAVSSSVTISMATSVTVPNDVLHITSASSSPAISSLDDDDLLFRTRLSDQFSARAMAQIISNQGADSAAVLYLNNDFGKALATAFEETYGGTTTAMVGFESGQSSYQQKLSKVFADDPEFVAFAGYPESGTTILSQWHEGGYGGQWMLHNSMLSSDVIENVGADVMNGMWGVRTKPPTSDATDAFTSDYESEYPDAQLFSPYSWNSYDALMSYALAVHHAGTTDPNTVKNSLRTIATPPGESVSYAEFEAGTTKIDDETDIDYSGPSGNVDYDENGDVSSDMVAVRVQNGEFTNAGTIPAEDLQ